VQVAAFPTPLTVSKKFAKWRKRARSFGCAVRSPAESKKVGNAFYRSWPRGVAHRASRRETGLRSMAGGILLLAKLGGTSRSRRGRSLTSSIPPSSISRTCIGITFTGHRCSASSTERPPSSFRKWRLCAWLGFHNIVEVAHGQELRLGEDFALRSYQFGGECVVMPPGSSWNDGSGFAIVRWREPVEVVRILTRRLVLGRSFDVGDIYRGKSPASKFQEG
jgi:hypothetical protein